MKEMGNGENGFSVNYFVYFKSWLKDIKHFEVFTPIFQISQSLKKSTKTLTPPPPSFGSS